jgi:hypothetical protein
VVSVEDVYSFYFSPLSHLFSNAIYYCAYMYVNGKTISVETIPGMEEGVYERE